MSDNPLPHPGGPLIPATPLERLWWPERVPISDLEREVAAARIAQAQAGGLIIGTEADRRRSRLPAARTREDLRIALKGLPGAVIPAGLLTACRVVTAVWLGVTLVNLAVWILVCSFSRSVINPWWAWPAVVGGGLAFAVWWVADSAHRQRFSGSREGRNSHA
ncbi:DUF1707 domain-containing protein [Nonomuraea jiangxiensis]|uniref:DUF1707 domain-containing protein n=1 Tax=Nonomuraea jiangxiensis TaxID=633440 RepID=A0A1G9JLB1_9ACTN|nr:DUF1707 domain-containing protein [Nonomuraea jiangxiensis]SDL38357.1 protein of unknown function [Nonomuraea jiangxiensis]